MTGRLSSNDPNLQNIPVRTPEGRRVREAFVAPEGKLIASADYSQIELRIMAHLSGDEALLSAFKNGLDVHRATAAEVFGVSVDEVSSEQRRYAKVINFGLIYGMSSFGLAKNLGIETKAAAAYIDKYFQRYPGVKRYMDQTVELAHAQGYVETVFGRRLVLPEINGGNGPRKKAAERAAINAPMQGTAADLIKKAMVAVQARLDAEKPEVLVIMQVHDELVFELPESARDWVQAEIRPSWPAWRTCPCRCWPRSALAAAGKKRIESFATKRSGLFSRKRTRPLAKEAVRAFDSRMRPDSFDA